MTQKGQRAETQRTLREELEKDKEPGLPHYGSHGLALISEVLGHLRNAHGCQGPPYATCADTYGHSMPERRCPEQVP